MSNETKINTMGRITVGRSELLEKIESNKKLHDELLEMSVEAYEKQIKEEKVSAKKTFKTAIEKLEEKFDEFIGTVDSKVKAGENIYFDRSLTHLDIMIPFGNLEKPENHSADYDSAIMKVKMSSFELISLSEQEFEKYVMNNWEWKDNFKMAAIAGSTYVSGSASDAALNF